jgi:hypothetical protein
VIGEYPIDLFRHLAIEASETGLDMSEFCVEFARRDCTGENGVGVALYQDDMDILVSDDPFDPNQHLSSLLPVSVRSDAEMVIGLREAQSFKKDAIEFVGVVLSGMNERVRNVTAVTDPKNRGQFDYFRPRSKNDRNSCVTH